MFSDVELIYSKLNEVLKLLLVITFIATKNISKNPKQVIGICYPFSVTPYFTVAVERERDELLALLDVQERQRYEVTRSQSTAEEQAYNNFTSAEVNFCLIFCFFLWLPTNTRH